MPDPASPTPGQGAAPMPVIVGAPRSGTTLLRMMLDSHPAIAIPPETGFLPACAALAEAGTADAAALIDLIERPGDPWSSWVDFGLDRATLAEALGRIRPFDVAGDVRAFYRAYAARHGKPLGGDKTPAHVAAIPAIARLLPEARFIHLIRDGRAAAASLRPLWFAPGTDIETLARHWRDLVAAGRAAAAAGHPVLELRYEALLAEPEAALRRAAAFLRIDYDPAMLRYHERAATRLAEHQGRVAADGTVLLDRDRRLDQQRLVREPLRPARAEAWRGLLTPAEIRAFGVVAGDLLAELGYRPD